MRVSERHPRGSAGSRGVQFRMRETLSVSRVYVMCVTVTRSKDSKAREDVCTSEADEMHSSLYFMARYFVMPHHRAMAACRLNDARTQRRQLSHSVSHSSRVSGLTARFVRSTPPPMHSDHVEPSRTKHPSHHEGVPSQAATHHPLVLRARDHLDDRRHRAVAAQLRDARSQFLAGGRSTGRPG